MRSLQPFRNNRDISPLRDMRRFMSQFDDFFNEMTPDLLSARTWPESGLESLAEFTPSVDIEENDEMYLISADLPGLKKDDIKIDISGNTMKVSGEKHREIKEEGYYERSSGRFSRSFNLPESVDTKKVEANFEDGVLKIVLPKTEVKASHQEIKIQSGAAQSLLDRFSQKQKTNKVEDKNKH